MKVKGKEMHNIAGSVDNQGNQHRDADAELDLAAASAATMFISSRQARKRTVGNGFVSVSAVFRIEGTRTRVMSPLATASRT